jgi:hypothetical protein
MNEIFIFMSIKVKKYKKLSAFTFKFVNIERKLQEKFVIIKRSPLKQTRITWFYW